LQSHEHFGSQLTQRKPDSKGFVLKSRQAYNANLDGIYGKRSVCSILYSLDCIENDKTKTRKLHVLVFEKEEGSPFDVTKATAFETYKDFENNVNCTELTLNHSESQLDLSLTYDIRNTLESM